MKKLLGYLFLILVLLVTIFLICYFAGIKGQDKRENIKLPYKYSGIKQFYPWFSQTGQIEDYKGFSLMYNEDTEQPRWVLYILTHKMLTGKKYERTDKFVADRNIISCSATPSDYKHSGYDKGHLCPAADMAWSAQSESECFYMSNMSPQVPGFNRGIWKTLEEKVRKWAKINDSIVVITGPVIADSSNAIGANKVIVPAFFYKVVADISYPTYKTIAFLMPNKTLDDDIYQYAVSVDSVENILHADFFSGIEILEQTEASLDKYSWN